jgi:hypothetical protein
MALPAMRATDVVLHFEMSVQEIHRRIAEKLRHECVRRISVDIERATHLYDLALVHDADVVAHRHRLDLVMRHVNRRRADIVLLLDQLVAGGDAQCSIQIGQRLVEQEHLWITNDRAAERYALALTAGKGVRLALQQLRQAKSRRRVVHSPVEVRRTNIAPPQAESQIVVHSHVRVQGMGIETPSRYPATCRNLIHDPPSMDTVPDVIGPGPRSCAARWTCHSRTGRAGP